jgi:hypothetical protein
MSRPKAMGTAVETAVTRWLQGHGFPDARRLPLSGAADCGDVELQRDPKIIAEVKRAQCGLQLTPWMAELRAEVRNSVADLGLLVMKQAGCGESRTGRFATAMRYPDWLRLFSTYQSTGGEGSLAECSPMHVNSRYVTTLAGPGTQAKAFKVSRPLSPFALVRPPGSQPCQGSACGPGCGYSCPAVVLGPLEQFVPLLFAAGYGRRERP